MQSFELEKNIVDKMYVNKQLYKESNQKVAKITKI